jgi:hypothetical protein
MRPGRNGVSLRSVPGLAVVVHSCEVLLALRRLKKRKKDCDREPERSHQAEGKVENQALWV